MDNLILNSKDPHISSGYGAELSSNLKGQDIKSIVDQIEEAKFAAAAEIAENKGWKNPETKKVQAIGYTVIFTQYPRNPYRKYKSNAGLFIPDSSLHLNEQTGEMEEDELGIVCCNVVSVGPECKYIKEGDDIYIRPVGIAPIPFNQQGYWAISEQNVICKVVNND